MKILEQPDGLEGYVVLVEEKDIKTPVDLPELKRPWVDIINDCEGAVLKDGLFHCVYLTNNELAIEFLIPDAECLTEDIRNWIHTQLWYQVPVSIAVIDRDHHVIEVALTAV